MHWIYISNGNEFSPIHFEEIVKLSTLPHFCFCFSGEYRVELPDGRTQIVTYHADHEGGFVADVK